MGINSKYSIQESFEIINQYAENPQSKEIEEVLREIGHDSVLLKYLRIALGVDYTFSPDLGVDFPAGVRLNRDFPDGISDSQLRYEHRGFYLYEDRHHVEPAKRLKLFGNMLENLHWKEADLVIQIKDYTFNDFYPFITLELMNWAYPHLFPLSGIKKDVVVEKQQKEIAVPVVDNIRDAMSLDTNERTLTTVKPTPKFTQASTMIEESKQSEVKEEAKLDKRSKAYRESIGRTK